MLRYSVDLEILSDLYDEYMKHSSESAESIHRIGRAYLPFIEEYGLDENSARTIREVAEYENEEEPGALQSRLLKAHLDRKALIKVEREQYNSFCMTFSGDTRRALMKLPEFVFGRKIPYRLKDRSLHIDVVDLPSVSLSLDFDDVLIEDGRSPREIIIEHFAGEKIVQARRVRKSDGTEEIVELPAYRFSFVNGLGTRRYPQRVSSFTCTGVSGHLSEYDYAGYPGEPSENTDKLAYRRLYYLLDSFTGKVKSLGIGSLNENEITFLPLFNIFHKLTGMYLDPATMTAAGVSLISYDRKKALEIRLDSADIESTCSILRPHGFKRLISKLEAFEEDRDDFFRFWVRYASSKQSSHLYAFLMERLGECSAGYRRHPLPLPYRKYHAFLRRFFDEKLTRKGWSGSFPCYYLERELDFKDETSVYSRKYAYLNKKKKSYYVDFMESVTGDSYIVTSLSGEILLRDGEDASDFCALDGCFSDGARRRNHISGRLVIGGSDDNGRILDAAGRMADSVTNAVRGEV